MSYLINSIALGQNIIPYRKELRSLCGSATSVLLFSQLLYWFEKYDYQEFYKFISPCPNSDAYKNGDSWEEELGFSYEEFSNAFSKIGEKFISKGKFEEGFKNEKMFYAFTDKIKGLTYWGINKELVEKRLFEVYETSQLRKPTKSNYVNRQSPITELGKVGLDLKQKTNTVEYTEDLSLSPAKQPISKIDQLNLEVQSNPLFDSMLSIYPKISKERLQIEINFALGKYIELGRISGAFSYVRSYLSNADFKDVLTNKKLEIEDEINSKRKSAYENKISSNSNLSFSSYKNELIEIDPTHFESRELFEEKIEELVTSGKEFKRREITVTNERIWRENQEKLVQTMEKTKFEIVPNFEPKSVKTPMEIMMEAMKKTNPNLAEKIKSGSQNTFFKIAQKLTN